MQADISVNLHGVGHLTSIGARFETRICPRLPGETATKQLQQICVHVYCDALQGISREGVPTLLPPFHFRAPFR